MQAVAALVLPLVGGLVQEQRERVPRLVLATPTAQGLKLLKLVLVV